MRTTLTFAVTLFALGCTHPTPTQVLVVLDGDASLIDSADQLRIEVVNQEGASRVWDIAIAPREPAGTRFPVTLPLVPRDGDPSRTFEVTADLMRNGDVIARQRASSGYVADELRVVRIQFAADCSGMLCESGTTCRLGECVDACVEPGLPDDRSIRGCPMADAGPRDAGPSDAGSFDAGPSDAGPPDAGPASTCATAHPSAIFCDGFERPIEEVWDRGTSEIGGLVEPVTTGVFRGTTSMRALATDTDPSRSVWIDVGKNVTGIVDDLYVRIQLYVPSDHQPTTQINFAFAGETSASPGGVAMGLMPGLIPFTFNHGAGGIVMAEHAIDTDRWVCIEAHSHIAVDGLVELWVEEARVGWLEEDTTLVSPVVQFLTGVTLGRGQPSFYLMLDEIVLDDERIHCN